MNSSLWRSHATTFICALIAASLVVAVYWSGLHGGYVFDDFPNIVDNRDVQPASFNLTELIRAAFSSPSSELKRPLASVSFALNFLAGGADPFGFKATNLTIHLLNGWLVYLVSLRLLELAGKPGSNHRRGAYVVALGWMLLPINLTAVLYTVQRMESLANLFVLLGLLGYLEGRAPSRGGVPRTWLAMVSVVVPTVLGVLAKETAIMLPLYAACVEWLVIRSGRGPDPSRRTINIFFIVVLVVPAIAGLAFVIPAFLGAKAWANRDFTLGTRLLSETRIVVDYVQWIIAPLPHQLSFYHDDFRISQSLFAPWTTLLSAAAIAIALFLAWHFRRLPLFALGICLYLGCHVLTGTVLPLELIYEHRNYFASFPILLMALPPLLQAKTPMPLARGVLLAALFVWWITLTAWTAKAWGEPLALAQELAARAPESPRAQYELGRTYIISSRYEPSSRFIPLARSALERAAALPTSTILPEQALIYLYSRMKQPVNSAWWKSMIGKLAARHPGVQDESSLDALSQCQIEDRCDLDSREMQLAYEAAISHQVPSARLVAIYGNYAWNVLDDKPLATSMLERAVKSAPNEPAYRQTLGTMLAADGHLDRAQDQLNELVKMNFGGRTSREITAVTKALSAARSHSDDGDIDQ